MEVVVGTKKEEDIKRISKVIENFEMWKSQYEIVLNKLFAEGRKMNSWSQEEMMKLALSGVKYVNACDELVSEHSKLEDGHVESMKETKEMFGLLDGLMGVIGKIQLKNLIKIFPVDKNYDGEKYGSKDYFFTMDVLREKGMDTCVGKENVFDLLWDYENSELRNFMCVVMDKVKKIHAFETGEYLTEKFLHELGVESYTMDKENGILINNETGEIYPQGENKETTFEFLD